MRSRIIPFDMHRRICTLVLGILLSLSATAQTAQPQQQTQPNAGPDATIAAPQAFSLAVAERLMNDLRDGFIGQNSQRTMQVFAANMPGYQQLADDIGTLFDTYESFRVRYRILQTVPDADGQRGSAMVEFTLEGTPRTAEPPVRRTAQLKLEFERYGKQWKIASVEPRKLFSSF